MNEMYDKAEEGILFLCGRKFDGILDNITSLERLDEVRRDIFSDCSYNGYSDENIEYLRNVLLFLNYRYKCITNK